MISVRSTELSGSVFANHSQKHFLPSSPRNCKFESSYVTFKYLYNIGKFGEQDQEWFVITDTGVTWDCFMSRTLHNSPSRNEHIWCVCVWGGGVKHMVNYR